MADVLKVHSVATRRGFRMTSDAGAAVMNAIHNATGARIRDLPATPDNLLAAVEGLDDHG